MAYNPLELPNTAHSVFYSYAITAGASGTPIGSFEKFGSSFTRTHERIREVLFNHGPVTNEITWGGTDIQVTITRVELYNESIFLALGRAVDTIEEFNSTVDIHEWMYIPTSPGNPALPPNIATSFKHLVYEGCVPTNVSKDIDTGATKILVNMTLECRTVRAVV